MQVGYVEPLSRAFERMRRILFEPFDLVKWLVLGFSAWLAKLASGLGGGPNFVLDRSSIPSHAGGRGLEELLEHAWILPLVALAAILVLGFLLLLLWLSSRAKFVFLDNVVTDQARIVEPWRRFRRLGNSLLWWRVGFGLACLVVVVVVLAATVGPAMAMGAHDAFAGLSFAAVFVAVLVLSVFAVAAAYVSLFLDSFVVPIMYRFDLKATDAWRALLPWLSSHGGWFLLYGVVILLLAVGFGLVFLLVCLVTCCIAALPYVGTVVFLPVWVAYRAFSVEFLAQLHPDFDLFATGAAAAAHDGQPEPRPAE